MSAALKRTIPATRRLSRDERKAGMHLVVLHEQRPRTRADCLPGGSNAMRPCPFVSCKYHLALDVTESGSLVLNHPGREIDELPETCALDVADRGEQTLEDIGRIFGVTRERARQLEADALMEMHLELRSRRGSLTTRDAFCPSDPSADDTEHDLGGNQ